MVLYGALVITAGHIVLAFAPGPVGLGAGLLCIVAGTGALKTNITSIVGFVLDQNPKGSHRDAGFSYFYMAINIGAVAGPLTTGLVQSELGFHYGFALAAVGMGAALVQYVASVKHLPERARTVNNPLPAGRFLTLTTSSAVSGDERRRVLGYLPLFLASGVYFGFLFQKFTAISILITERIDLHIGGWKFPVAWITTVSPLALVLVIPLAARMWNTLGERQPGPVTKVAIGLTQIGCAYLFLLVISEATGHAPGLNFLTLALGSSLAGLLGQLFTVIDNASYFALTAVCGIALGLALLVARGPVDRLLRTGLDR